jgi:hypothetical protein
VELLFFLQISSPNNFLKNPSFDNPKFAVVTSVGLPPLKQPISQHVADFPLPPTIFGLLISSFVLQSVISLIGAVQGLALDNIRTPRHHHQSIVPQPHIT